MKNPPIAFDGTLQELYEGWCKDVLLPPDVVEEFHQRLLAYLNGQDPVYLVRMVSGLERGRVMRIANGSRLRPTDNSPAWWIHYQLSMNQLHRYETFEDFLNTIPCHIFQIRLPENISTFGWHVAHLYPVKDRDTQYQAWTQESLIKRMVRNIHPCNYFYLPKCAWRIYGGHPAVISFFYDQFQKRYRTIWQEFLTFAHAELMPISGREGEFAYRYRCDSDSVKTEISALPSAIASDFCAVTYSSSRLCFKADVIEALEMEDGFCVVTPDGTFAMTRRAFYETFPNVIQSQSYRLDRIYHYPKPPKKASQFRVK